MAEAYSLGCPAEDMYEHLSRYRQQVIDVGRKMASITIPSVFPPQGYRTGDKIGTNNQSFGALCVNTLASKLMFMAFSPFRPILRYQVIEHKLQSQINQNPHLWSMIQVGLSKLEIEHRNRLEATAIRSQYVGAMKALLVAGNVCWDHMHINRPVYHLPTSYVVKRNQQGEPTLVIVAQLTDIDDLDEDVKAMVYAETPKLGNDDKRTWERQATIYRVCKLCFEGDATDDDSKKYWEYWEEYKGKVIADTEFEAKYEEPPLYAAWLIPVVGQNWGRGYCEEFRGDLMKVENLESALNDGAAAASLLWFFLNPGSRTSLRQLKQAENLALMVGKAGDVESFKLDKGSDFAFVDKNLERTIQRLGRAFLLISSIQRQAERVTAEEWGMMAKEIDEAMGGLYSEIGQSVQTHVVRRFVALHNDEDKDLPKLPKGIFRVAIISAIDAMGRALEGQTLLETTTQIMATAKEAAAQRIDWSEFIRRMYTSASIPQEGLVVSEEQVRATIAQQQQDAMKAEMVSKGTGPAINAMGGAMQQQLPPPPTPGPDGSAPPSPAETDALSPPPAQ